MRVAVIGLGVIGKIHTRIYSELPQVELVGVVDADSGTLAAVAKQYNIPGFSSVEELFSQPIDAVSVCVPTELHHKVGCQVIERGVPVLIEKPLARTVEEGESLVNKARQGNVPLMVGHVERFNPAIWRIKESVRQDKVISIQITRVGPFPPRVRDIGIVTDLGAHDIDLVHFIAESDFEHIFAVCSYTRGGHEDTAIIVAQMKNGVLAQITENWLTPYKSRQIRIATPDRYIEGDLITQQVKEYSNYLVPQSAYQVKEWPLFFKEPLHEELVQFIGAVQNGQKMPITGEDGLYVLQNIERILNNVPKTQI